MRIDALETGRVRGKRRSHGLARYLGNDWSDETLPVRAFLVRHPSGLCLFDTGQTARAAQPGHFPSWHPFFRLSRFELDPAHEAHARLADLGVPARDVTTVVLSHLHTDHVGDVGAFEHARVYVCAEEWQRAQGIGGRLRGYLPGYWPDHVEPILVRYGHGPIGPFPDSFHLDEAGALTLVPLPGHTPGHMALLVRDGGQGALLAGDAAHTRRELEEREPAIVRWCDAERMRVLLTHEPPDTSG